MEIPKSITSELAEETGWHIGDGSMNFYLSNNKQRGIYQLRGHILDDVEHYKTRIKPIYKELYDYDVSLREMHTTGVFGFQIWSNELVNFKHNILKLPLGQKREIGIPQMFLRKKELMISSIRGIFDTDGCLYLEHKNNKLYPRVKITTTSEYLAKQIKVELSKLNIQSGYYVNLRNNPRWRDVHVIEVRGIERVNKWFDIINPKNPKFIEKYKKLANNS
nr:hypothetical protein [Nanoarchaeum sp.]